MKSKSFATALLAVILSAFPAFSQDNKIVVGESVTLHSKILNEDRELLIHLPHRYESSKKRCPVLYLLDGESHFLHVIGVTEFFSDMGRMPEMIVVGIVSTNRNRDLTPPSTDPADDAFAPGNGGSEKFYQCLTQEILPFINGRYRTEPCNVLAGHSFGGLFAINAMLAGSPYFSAYIAASPSVYWNHYDAHRRARDFFLAKKNTRKFLYFTVCGMEDPEVPDAVKSWYDFAAVAQTYAPKDFKWKFDFMPYDDHGTTPPQTFYAGLRFVFENWSFPLGTLFRNLSVDDWRAHYGKLSADFGYDCKPEERRINRQAYMRLGEGRLDAALALFKYNVELYPNSANAHDGLGEAYARNGQKELAVTSYEMSLKLNPRNANAVEKLKELKAK